MPRGKLVLITVDPHITDQPIDQGLNTAVLRSVLSTAFTDQHIYS